MIFTFLYMLKVDALFSHLDNISAIHVVIRGKWSILKKTTDKSLTI